MAVSSDYLKCLMLGEGLFTVICVDGVKGLRAQP